MKRNDLFQEGEICHYKLRGKTISRRGKVVGLFYRLQLDDGKFTGVSVENCYQFPEDIPGAGEIQTKRPPFFSALKKLIKDYLFSN